MILAGAGGFTVLPALNATETALLITALGSVLIGLVSIVINRKGAAESRKQQEVAHELDRRSQGYDEMRGIAEERAADLREARSEHVHMQERIDRLREENRLLRELTRAQVGLSAAAGLIPPMDGEGPDRAHLVDRPPLPAIEQEKP